MERGHTVVGSEVTFKEIGGNTKTRLDLLVRTAEGELYGVEGKMGKYATFSKNQKNLFPKLSKEGSVPVGKNAVEANLSVGQELGPINIEVLFWNDCEMLSGIQMFKAVK